MDELLPDNEALQQSEYNESVSELALTDVDPSRFPIYLIPSCFIKDTEGDFTVTVMAQTHGVTLTCTEVTLTLTLTHPNRTLTQPLPQHVPWRKTVGGRVSRVKSGSPSVLTNPHRHRHPA